MGLSASILSASAGELTFDSAIFHCSVLSGDLHLAYSPVLELENPTMLVLIACQQGLILIVSLSPRHCLVFAPASAISCRRHKQRKSLPDAPNPAWDMVAGLFRSSLHQCHRTRLHCLFNKLCHALHALFRRPRQFFDLLARPPCTYDGSSSCSPYVPHPVLPVQITPTLRSSGVRQDACTAMRVVMLHFVVVI